VPAISFARLVPDASKSLQDGAIAAWTTPAYRHELDELLELADDYGLPVDVPFSQLRGDHLRLISEGVPERNFGGLHGFFRWLERHRYKLSVRVFLNRWRAYETCSACQGARLQPGALAVQVGGLNIDEICRMPIGGTIGFCNRLRQSLPAGAQELANTLLPEVRARLRYLANVGLGYLTLDRPVRTLSGGEARRVALTAALGSSLVRTLYVFDEPSAGLHPRDNEKVIAAVKRLCAVGNTVVVVEHDEAFLRAADEIVDIGPGAGRDGGHVVFQGPPAEIGAVEQSVTGAYLSGRREIAVPRSDERRKPDRGRITLEGARHRNLNNLTVSFPLGLLCVVTGVSGSGKSTLIRETLYPAICRQLAQLCAIAEPGALDHLCGADQIDDVVLVDSDPVGRTRRSNPVTYLKVFDEIRKVFAETRDARLRSFSATTFSFNAAQGGRCPKCRGNGTIDVDMQFLADVAMTCPECHGRRFRQDVLDVKYRGLSIADVLEMTVREAFTFFRTHRKLLKKLHFLTAVGLDYLPLGQPATTLSGGELQRLKLAVVLASGSKSRTLFLIDEPTTGLHAADVARLLDCFAGLLSVGHSLIVIEHNLDVIKSADFLIDLGPEAGTAGGQLVASGTPEDVAAVPASITGGYLRSVGVVPVLNEDGKFWEN
jgi:excinuclease ABC subunit A